MLNMQKSSENKQFCNEIHFFSFYIGFTDFEEGSKSEIFRRCDAGASNENMNCFARNREQIHQIFTHPLRKGGNRKKN
jgi:hypothetical protein